MNTPKKAFLQSSNPKKYMSNFLTLKNTGPGPFLGDHLHHVPSLPSVCSYNCSLSCDTASIKQCSSLIDFQQAMLALAMVVVCWQCISMLKKKVYPVKHAIIIKPKTKTAHHSTSVVHVPHLGNAMLSRTTPRGKSVNLVSGKPSGGNTWVNEYLIWKRCYSTGRRWLKKKFYSHLGFIHKCDKT